MAATNPELANGLILKEDLYKDNTLLLKKGIILNAYLINKLNKFGIYPQMADVASETKTEALKSPKNNTEILIYQHNIFDANKTKGVLEYAGFLPGQIFVINDLQKIPFGETNISYIFLDSIYFDENFMDNVSLLQSQNKIRIFVLGCDNYTPRKLNFNTDTQIVKFLYRPLANDYIKALLNLYS